MKVEETDEIIASRDAIAPMRGVDFMECASKRRESIPVDDIEGNLNARIDMIRSTATS